MATWQRWREPLAVTLLAGLAGLLVVRVIDLALTGLAGPMGLSGPDDMLLIAAALAGLWCAKAPASQHARPILISGCVLVGLTIASWLVIGAVGLGQLSNLGSDPAVDQPGGFGGAGIGRVLLALGLAEGLLRLVLPIVSLVALAIALRGLAAVVADSAVLSTVSVADDLERDGSGGSVGAQGPQDCDHTESDRAGLDQSAVGGTELRTSPTASTWQPSDAAGAVWLTADDAAQGAPATGWGTESWAPPAAAAPEFRRAGVSSGDSASTAADLDRGGVSYGWSAPAVDDRPGGVSYVETTRGVPEVVPGGVSQEQPPAAEDDDDDDDLR